MDLPDCPPGAEGYEDTVVEKPKKPEAEENCTKAEQEFQEYLNSQKIVLDDGESRCMVERRGRDSAGKWIYLCYPCSAMCSGETTLQAHILGKKHKNNMSTRQVWSKDIFTNHPYNLKKNGAAEKKPEEAVTKEAKPSGPESEYNKYKNITCELQSALDIIKVPIIGLEYLIEFPPEQAHYKSSYLCTLCNKHGHPRTIINHMICLRHQYNYLRRHYQKAMSLLAPYWPHARYQEGVTVVISRFVQRVEDTHGRKRPLYIDNDEFNKDRESILQWIYNDHHFSENDGSTFVEVVDIDLITTLEKNVDKTSKDSDNANGKSGKSAEGLEPSPPKVAAPTKPLFNNFMVRRKRTRTRRRPRRGPTSTHTHHNMSEEDHLSPTIPTPAADQAQRSTSRQERRAGSVESLSDISDDLKDDHDDVLKMIHSKKNKMEVVPKSRYMPYPAPHPPPHPRPHPLPRHAYRNAPDMRRSPDPPKQNKTRPGNYNYKIKLAEDQRVAAEASAKKTYAYHEKNPEKHPLYPEEWKKFWNRRYKEIQTEGKDPSKHDFKPEWIQFWTKRMKEIYEDELRITLAEIYRKLCVSPPDMNKKNDRPPEPKKRSPEPKRRTPEPKWHIQDPKRRSPEMKRRDVRRWTPDKRRSPERRRSPEMRRDHRRDRKSPQFYHSPPRRRTPSRPRRTRSRSPHFRVRSPPRSSRSPLARRDLAHASRNRSPHRNVSADRVAPSMQTVLISDDELKPDDGLSPWNSADEMSSPTRSRTGSVVSRASRARHEAFAAQQAPHQHIAPAELGPTDNVVATLRLLVALEDHLGSLGPKVIDLLGQALQMEKEKANSSEELVERETVVVTLETVKEKLKGAAQAGLVPAAAAGAVRAAVVRVAATLHDAETRKKRRQKNTSAQATASKSISKGPEKAVVPVAGVGEVDRVQIAEQMAAALVAQGKTDVSSEELAQLVDAVIGMAEAKKKAQSSQHDTPPTQADSTHTARPAQTAHPTPRHTPKTRGTVSALQMLQSAYDENKDKLGKEDGPDAMDGLSDSDLETLLKNFNELSAEEQHSLIAYLKKLEAKEPQRVERLRQYVSAAVTTAPPLEEEPPAGTKAIAIESDDDDEYTVEEVFKSAKEKVKEDQIRQEMEIVKKSLEESKPPSTELPKTSTIIDLTKSLSSASDLFALVQASIQSQAPATPSAVATTAEVVHSNLQPKSFGDLPETQVFSQPAKPLNNPHSDYPFKPQQQMHQQQNFNTSNNQQHQQNFARPQHNPNFGGNRNIPNDNYNQPRWVAPINNNIQDQRGPRMQSQQFDNNYNQGPYNQGSNPNFNKRQDFEIRPPIMNQQYGNYNSQNNFRGRGQYGGPMRGRGRGGYY